MNIWTAEDLQQVKAAIVQLAIGDRAVSVSFNGPDGSHNKTEYQPTDLDKLKGLAYEIQVSLAEQSPSSLIAQSNKGVF